MPRRRTAVAVVLFAASLAGAAAVAVVPAACSPSCKAGTLLLHVALLDDAPLADRIVVSGDDPNAAVSESFPHTPNPDAVTIGVDRQVLTITWPTGYPAGNTVNLTIRALAGDVQLGINTASIHLDSGCSETSVLVSNRGVPPDLGGSD